jgi:hypothetical protein
MAIDDTDTVWRLSGRIIYTEKEEANFQTGRPFLFTKFKMNAQQVPQCKQRRVIFLFMDNKEFKLDPEGSLFLLHCTGTCGQDPMMPIPSFF